MLSKLRQRLKEKESALEQALDEKYAAIEEKDNEIHQLQLSLREKERDLDRLSHLLAHNEETINSFDGVIKEKDVELQHLANTLKNLQRAKQDVEDNLNRSLREKDSIISQLQLSLEGKTKDMEEIAESMLNQSQTQARDLAEQMGQRLKVTEAMLADAVKARERLVADNESAVEGLLATISSKDQLLKESAEHFNRMLSERTQEIQDLRKQLTDKQQELSNAEKQSSSTAQESYLETAELKTLLAEKDKLIDKLLQRGQERDRFLAEVSQKAEPDQVLELRQTIQIMQDKLDEKEGELSRRNSEDNQENITFSRKTVVVLKKELAQKTEALNKALKRENELKIALADLQSSLSELEGRSEGQAATLKTKEEIISVLHQRLSLGGSGRADHTQDHVIGSDMERSPPELPQRERTLIGGDSQQEAVPSLVALQQEHDALNKALRAEQQLYSSLARLGAIQNRGGGVGGANDSCDTLSFIGDQTSYMSICVGEGADDSLSQLSSQELQQKVLDLQGYVSGLQSLNTELQSKLSQMEKSEQDRCEKEDGDLTRTSRCKQQFEKMHEKQVVAHGSSTQPPGQDKESQTNFNLEEVASRRFLGDNRMESRLSQSREHARSDNCLLDFRENSSTESSSDMTALKSLLVDFGSTSVSELREELLQLRSENAALRGLLKEQKSTEFKEKESKDASGNSSDGQAELRKSLEMLHAKSKDGSKVFEESREKKSGEVSERETPVTTDGTADETESSKPQSQSPSRRAKQHVSRHRPGFRSLIPVPVRQADAPSHLHSIHLCGSNQDLHTDSDSPLEHCTSSSSTVRYTQTSCSSAGSDRISETRKSEDRPQKDSTLFTQLELLHQQCQEKETLINKMTEQLADFEELHARLQEKEMLNSQYTEALQAAQSTIAYLTACSLDNQSGFGPHSVVPDGDLHDRCMALQKALQEKEELNNQLIDLLNMAEKAVTSSHDHDKHPETGDFCLKIESALHQVNASTNTESSRPAHGDAEECLQELQRRADSLQESLLEQSRLNAELQEQLRDANAAAQRSYGGDGVLLNGTASRDIQDESKERLDTKGEFIDIGLNQEAFSVLLSCFSAAESAVASLASHCSNTTSDKSVRSELQMNLDNLQRALQERAQLLDAAQPSTKAGGGLSAASEELKLHRDLCLLHKVFRDSSQRISDLQTAHRMDGEVQKTTQDTKGLPPDVKLQLETLHKALREKKKACRSLEEKLATALTNTPSPETARKDLEVGVNPGCGASSLLKHEHITFSSTENLDSTSSTPYPSSPALSSAKVSLKGLQVYDEYGASEDPLQLQAQVRELKGQLENQTRLILQMQSFLRRNSLPSDLAANASDPVGIREQETTQKTDRSQERSGQLGKKTEAESQTGKDRHNCLNMELERERTPNQSTCEHLRQTRSRSTSPARLDSLVQSQARELSQLRQQIKESRRLGALHRQQLEELNKAFKELLHAGEVDRRMGEVIKEQLDKSLNILDSLEGRLDKEGAQAENQDVSPLETSRRLAKELQEKNQLIESLQNQIRARSPSSLHSSHSDLTLSSCHSSPSTQGGSRAHGQQHHTNWTGVAVPPVGGVEEKGVCGHRDAASRVQGLQREKGLLQEQLRSSEELNATLRTELDLHRSIMAQTSFHHPEQECGNDQEVSEPGAHKQPGDVSSPKTAAEQPPLMNSDLLSEHLQEIRALRQRLEESIQTNDRLREQLERRLAEVEKDPAATNIFIHGSEEQGQLVNEVRFLWEQNQTLKDQLNTGSRDKQKENEKLRETLARRTAKLEQSRREGEALRQENSRLQERLEHSIQENSLLHNSLQSSKEELQRLQNQAKLQRQQLSDSQHLLQSLRVELQVHEKIKHDDSSKHNGSNETTQQPGPCPSAGSVDLGELLSEIRHLRLQLERSIRTNTALRQKLEEQLLSKPGRSETININYLLSSPDEGGRSPGRDSQRHSFQSHNNHVYDVKHHAQSEVDGSIYSSSGDSVSGAPSRLVPGHRMWANRNGRHVLGLIEDYNALRKQISEGYKLSRSMDTQLQECLHSSGNEVTERQHLKSLSSSSNTMQQVLEEAGRLLKLLWRVSLPGNYTAGDSGNNQQDELLKNEIARLKSRLSQQERMLSGAVKRLRTTNQLKEGMERVIIDQLSLTHGVLKKARGNLEEIPASGP
uniref:CDK5 regulatory subunit associated protein 2 n=1 Tax=Iconisemion striatum TaxID=60296 RepID=A0A1A7YZQ5_9TELE